MNEEAIISRWRSGRVRRAFEDQVGVRIWWTGSAGNNILIISFSHAYRVNHLRAVFAGEQ